MGRWLEFPPFRLDTVEEQLWRDAQPVALRAKNYAVLRHLVESAGCLVSTEELFKAIWPSAVVTPGTLNTTIREVRRALGDDTRHPRYIATVHRRGFRFVGEVRLHGGDDVPRGATERSASDCGALQVGSVHGRHGELETLGRHLAAARAGNRQIVFVSGDPGVGKTSLLRAFAARYAKAVAAGDLRMAVGRCASQRSGGEPFFAVLDALGDLSRSEAAGGLVATLKRFAPSVIPRLPWLLAPGEPSDQRRDVADASVARMLRELSAALEAISRDTPLVLILEDLHWSDPATVDLIGALAEREGRARLMVLATYRPADAGMLEHPIAPLRRRLQQSCAAGHVPLAPLPAEAVEGYLRERFDWGQPPAGLAPALHRETDGIPLFVVAVTAELVARRVLRRSDGRWSLTVPPKWLFSEVPVSLAEIVEDQLARLSVPDRRLLEVASVAGMTFTARDIAAGLGGESGQAEEGCSRLARRGDFIEEVGVARWPDGTMAHAFAFRRVAFQRVLNGRLCPGRRQALQLCMSRRPERGHVHCIQEDSCALANHFAADGHPAQAGDCLTRGGVVALNCPPIPVLSSPARDGMRSWESVGLLPLDGS